MKTIPFSIKKLSTYLLLSFVFILFSCSGEDGETGPPGNANVMVSDWMPIVWTWADFQEGEAFMDIPVEDMSEFVEDGGAALLYYKSSQIVRVLPIVNEFEIYEYDFGTYLKNDNFQTEAFEGFRFHYDGLPTTINILQNDPESFRVRYVLVPANVVETTGLSVESNLNFDETMDLLGMDPSN